MSVRERPVANRFLDMKEKELKYKNHINLIRMCKPQIDTKEVEMAPRFKLALRNHARMRARIQQSELRNTRMIQTVSRPQTPSALPEFQSYRYAPNNKRSVTKLSDLNMFDAQYEKRKKSELAKSKNVYTQPGKRYAQSRPLTRNGSLYGSENITIGTVNQQKKSKVIIITEKGKNKEELILTPQESESYIDTNNNESNLVSEE